MFGSLVALNKRSLKNIKERCEIYKNIITADKKILSSIYLKEYIDFSIAEGMVEHILKSPKFYEIITVLKNAYPYIEYDSANDKIKYKNNRTPCRKIYVFLYFVFLIPLILLMSYKELIQCGMDWLVVILIILSIPCTVAAISFLLKVGDMGQAIRLMKTLEEDHN
jgi:hypothetical protein